MRQAAPESIHLQANHHIELSPLDGREHRVKDGATVFRAADAAFDELGGAPSSRPTVAAQFGELILRVLVEPTDTDVDGRAFDGWFNHAALADGGELGALLDELRKARSKRDVLTQRIGALEIGRAGRFDRRTIEASVTRYLDHWRGLLASTHVHDGRQLLREVLDGPLRFTPDGRAYRFAGDARLGGLLLGVVGLPTEMVAVRGIEPRFNG